MSSKFGDIMVGDYNVLPRDSKQTPYTAPETMFLNRMPHMVSPILYAPMQLGWCRNFSRAQVEKEFPLADGYQELTRKAEGHWWGKSFHQDKVVHVHENWSEWPLGMNDKAIEQSKELHGQDSQPWFFGFIPMVAVFVGRLVGVAPQVCATIPCQGPIEKEYLDSVRVTVTNSTTEGFEFGLSAEAGINVKGAEVKRGASFKWSKSTTQTTEVSKSHDEKTTLKIHKEGQWGRIDVRLCAGVYAGWIAYPVLGDDSCEKFGIYPMLAPVHVPGFASPVAEHTMLADAGSFTSAELAALTAAAEYAQAGEQVATANGQLAPADVERVLATHTHAAQLLKNTEGLLL
ncbi:hypothetical protein ABZ924_36250 [Streptomyces sp. NPDC046876]|uniref:hypothetical protein n=1 Tax=Streptomyces sp. NPDC046876 TaxID=3155616 RepID=UPI0033D71114